jgi:hypothetical protein
MLKNSHLLIIFIAFAIAFAQDIDPSDSIEMNKDRYKAGYNAGDNLGARESPVYCCVGGLAAGVGGGCVGTMIAGWNDSDMNTLVASSIAGSVITGCMSFYGAEKCKYIPENMLMSDSLYNAGFIDGYLKATRKKRTINTIGGVLVGAGLSVFVICYTIGILSSMPMK